MGAIIMICGQIVLWSFCIYGIVRSHKVKRKEQERRKRECEERERKKQECEERERKKQEKKRQEELWRENHPEIMAEFQKFKEAKDSVSIQRWVKFFCEESYDGGRDGTGVTWYTLLPGETLEHAAEIFAERDRLGEKYGYDFLGEHFPDYCIDIYRWWGKKGDTFVYLDSPLPEEQLPDTPEQREKLLQLCREHHIHPLIRVRQDDDDFHDLLENCIWRVSIGEPYPGSADDAATYADTTMMRCPLEEE